MTVHKIYIGNDTTATFFCQQCQKLKGVDVTEYIKATHTVRIQCTCTCGHVHTVVLERRKFFRKEVELPGSYILNGEMEKRPMTVRDLSKSGLKIELAVVRDMKPGDTMWVEFRLDNDDRTLIRREVTIKGVFGGGIFLGAEFMSKEPNNPFDKAYDKTIGHYTLSK